MSSAKKLKIDTLKMVQRKRFFTLFIHTGRRMDAK